MRSPRLDFLFFASLSKGFLKQFLLKEYLYWKPTELQYLPGKRAPMSA